MSKLSVLAPQVETRTSQSIATSSAIEFISRDTVKSEQSFRELVDAHDVIQVNGGAPSWRSKDVVRAAKVARAMHKSLICGFSSDRVRTTVMNARAGTFPSRLRARMTSGSILRTAKKLSRFSDGVFLAGHGLVDRYAFNHPYLHVGIASWIKPEDVITEEEFGERFSAHGSAKALDMCIAARLEPMKGIGLALEALDVLRNKHGALPELAIYGQGPDYDRLVALRKELQLDDVVCFRGVVPYGQPFFAAIGQHDLMLLTNLNVEQPRVVFDSISQGLVPICPNSKSYKSLGIDPICLYEVGDPESLAAAIDRFSDRQLLVDMARKNLALVRQYTIHAMHASRARWVQDLLDRARQRRSQQNGRADTGAEE